MEERDDATLNAIHRTTYDRVASRYAAVNADVPAAVAASGRRFVALLGGSGHVLELGCGTGRDAAWLRELGLTLTVADLSAGMLHEAQSRVAGPWVQMDMRRPAFASGSFDGVWCSAAMIHLPKAAVPATLAGVRRVLATGGWFFVSMQVGTGEIWEDRSYGQDLRRFFARYDPGEFSGYLRRAGFQVAECDGNRSGPDRHWAHYLAQR